jgi:hypothetical protein
MWSKLDDQLIDHRKIFIAGELIGANGAALALALYTLGLLWTNKHLTDGHIPSAIVRSLPHLDNPAAVADALVHAGLWEQNGEGFVIHDFRDFNPTAAMVKRRRSVDRRRKAALRDS